MQFIIEAITRQDNLALLRFAAGECGIPAGEFCLWNGREGLAALPAAEFSAWTDTGFSAVEWGYSRILFDGIGMHALAGTVCALLAEDGVTAVSVSDIRLGILVPAAAADGIWLKVWSRFGAMLSDDRKIQPPGETEYPPNQ